MRYVCRRVEIVWKQTGQPTVQRPRERWVVRVAGIDTETGQRRSRQVGTFTSRRPRVRTADRPAQVTMPAYALFSSTDVLSAVVLEWMMAELSSGGRFCRREAQLGAGEVELATCTKLLLPGDPSLGLVLSDPVALANEHGDEREQGDTIGLGVELARGERMRPHANLFEADRAHPGCKGAWQ
jgi:hypothetical protein